MALFSRKKKDAPTATATKQAPTARPVDRDISSVIITPRSSEKAYGLSEKNVYTFVVARAATKYDVADAVRALYNVTPVKVNIVNKAPRRTMSRAKGRMITEKGLKKAYVYLKDGDTISLV